MAEDSIQVFVSPPLADPHNPCAARPLKKHWGGPPGHEVEIADCRSDQSSLPKALLYLWVKNTNVPCWDRCSNQPNLREIRLEVTPLSFGRRTVFGAHRGRRSKGLFSKKNMERRGQLHGDKDQANRRRFKSKIAFPFTKSWCKIGHYIVK